MIAAFALFASTALALTSPQDAALALPAAGIEVPLSRGWSADTEHSSSKEVSALGPGGARAWVTRTPYQVAIDADTARESARVATQRLQRLGAKTVLVVQSGVEEQGGRKVAQTLVEGKSSDGDTTYISQYSLAVEGAAVHISALGRSPEQAQSASLAMLRSARISQEPAPAVSELTAPDGEVVALPPGWRAPIGEELAMARRIMPMPEPETCWVALKPLGDGETRLLQGCPVPLHLGLVDERSLEQLDHTLRPLLFGAVGEDFPAAELTELDGRPVLTWTIAGKGKNDIAVAVAGSGNTSVATWIVGPEGEGVELASTLSATLASTRWPDGGYVVSARDHLDHALAHRPGLVALFLSPALLGMALVARRIHSMPTYRDDDDELLA